MKSRTTSKAPKASKDNTPGLAELQARIIPGLVEYAQANLHLAENVQSGKVPIVRVLAIDPGKTHMAICLLDLEPGHTHLTSLIEVPDNVPPPMRYLYLEQIVQEWIWTFRPTVVCKEGVAHGSTYGVAEAGRIQQLIERVCIDFQVPFLTIVNQSMRAYLDALWKEKSKAPGMRREVGATKSDVKKRVWQCFEVEPPTEDETDAYALGQTCIAILRGEYVVGGPKKK